jgi:hypothetical protein
MTARLRDRAWVPYAPLALALFVAAFVGGLSGAAPRVRISVTEPGAKDAYRPAMRTLPGQELVFVYIGSSGCSPSNAEFLPAAVEALKLRVAGQARRNGRSFAAVGVARDWDVERGLGHLRKFGRFDEVTTGRNWMNSGVLHYVWEDLPGTAATPQILVVDRRLVDRNSPEAAEGVIRDERLVVRKVGTEEIRRWLEHGAPMPQLHPGRRTVARDTKG